VVEAMKLEPRSLREWQDHKHDSQVVEWVELLELKGIYIVTYSNCGYQSDQYFDDFGSAFDLANELMEDWTALWFVSGDKKEKMR
jgi:hypothetical protein